MRLIKGPVDLPYHPRACAVTNRIDGDFVDFQCDIQPSPMPQRLYMKTAIVEQAARELGMVSKAEVEDIRSQFFAMCEDLNETKEIIDKANELGELVGGRK